MRLLLDTHALIWFANGSNELSHTAREAIEEAETVHVSAVNAFEISIKYRIGKMPEARTLAIDFEGSLGGRGLTPLPMTQRHAILAGAFVSEHRDPFDRAIAAQGIVEDLIVVSNDIQIERFGASRLW